MNAKDSELNRILDIVVLCCSSNLSDYSAITRQSLLGRERSENVIFARCILVSQIIAAGFSITTASSLLGKTAQSIRHLLKLDQSYLRTSHAYRLISDEATQLRKSQTSQP